jgi:hypothetical protein
MVDLFSRSKPAPARPPARPGPGAAKPVPGSAAAGNYARAIEALRAELKKRRGDERLRVQLAETLSLAGKTKEAAEVLNALADDLALIGQAGKAIAALKKVQKLDPGREGVEAKLAHLITHQTAPKFDPWKKAKAELEPIQPIQPPPPTRQRLAFGMEEIGDEPPDLVAAAPPPAQAQAASEVAPPPAAAPAEPGPAAAVAPAPPAGATEAEAASAEGALPSPEAVSEEEFGDFSSLFSEEGARDELASLIEDVFSPPAHAETPTAEQAPRAAASPLFKDFNEEELRAVIRGLRLRSYEPGEIIVSVGEAGESMFLLTTGRVRAYMRDKLSRHVQVREMGEGDFFGEISVLSGNPRSATITAATGCELLELDRSTLNSIAETHPNVRKVLQDFYKQRSTHTLEAALAEQPK